MELVLFFQRKNKNRKTEVIDFHNSSTNNSFLNWFNPNSSVGVSFSIKIFQIL